MAHGAPDFVTRVEVAVTVETEPGVFKVIVPEAATEYAIDTFDAYSGSTDTWEDLFNQTVPSGRIGILNSIELSCDNYAVCAWKVVVKGVTIMNGEILPESFTKEFPELHLSAEEQVLVQVKSDGSTYISAWCDVSYKEVA